MIEKILDKYFTKKLKNYISNCLLNWYIDTRFIRKGDKIELQIKKPYYKDTEYKTIYSFYEFSSLYYLLDREKLNTELENDVNEYLNKSQE